jgi:hypothetical protein
MVLRKRAIWRLSVVLLGQGVGQVRLPRFVHRPHRRAAGHTYPPLGHRCTQRDSHGHVGRVQRHDEPSTATGAGKCPCRRCPEAVRLNWWSKGSR